MLILIHMWISFLTLANEKDTNSPVFSVDIVESQNITVQVRKNLSLSVIIAIFYTFLDM